ncbi:MAG: S46 family peptidase [Planctomycetes bacterium]|nr:S46 family peptidase [Planctomycetota bacterium]
MWLFNQPPRELLKDRYGFDLTDAWLAKAQRASIRFNNGASGSFVSPDGLCVTNHHVGADSLQKLSTKEKNFYQDGFYAKSRDQELKCPDLELNVLDSIEEVTKEIQGAVEASMSAQEADLARRAIIAKLTKESLAKTGLRSDVVTLYNGGQYHLYRYKKYTDVRLVMAPEHAIAFFGGDTDNFEYPRYDLDICFFRVYEDGKPAKTPNYFAWSKTGPAEGDLVFVSGHPGTTNRLETFELLRHRRDFVLPYTLRLLRHREALLRQFAEKGPTQQRLAEEDLYSVANSRKALTGQYQGLLDPAILKTKQSMEAPLRATWERTGKDLGGKTNPWDRISASLENRARYETLYYLLERGDAFDSRLFRIARTLVRAADELPKDDGKRLPEFKSAGLESLKFQLFSPAPLSRELERMKLAGSLSLVAEVLSAEEPRVLKALAGASPAKRAAALVDGSKLNDVSERRRLFDGGKKAIDESTDPMIVLARLVDADARAVREKWDQDQEVSKQAFADITRLMFAQKGNDVPPDATFTLRLAYGVVKGYEEDGRKLPFTTTLGGAFERAEELNNREPFNMPKRWLDGRSKLDLKTPFNFVSTADTIGGNSGSPVLNRQGELVGINFDRNRHGLVRNFVYTEEQARHVSVHSRAVLEALRSLYDANELILELTGK